MSRPNSDSAKTMEITLAKKMTLVISESRVTGYSFMFHLYRGTWEGTKLHLSPFPLRRNPLKCLYPEGVLDILIKNYYNTLI
jgi:hypothetical protein